MDTPILQTLILSASLGALIGMIRQWGEQQGGADQTDREKFAGIRTFMLWALIGYSAAFLSDKYYPSAFPVALGVLGLHIIVQSAMGSKQGRLGYTTVAAAMITFFLGSFSYWQQYSIAVVLAALTMIVLGLKRPIHSWTRNFTNEDIRSTLQFVALTGVILPLVPNEGYGPYDAINPFSLWIMVVLISGMGFAGYILVRFLGAKSGIALTGLVGGLASSTATTLAFSRSSREIPSMSSGYALAVILACTVMLGRILFIVGFIYPPLVRDLWIPLLILALPGILYAAYDFFIKHAGGTPSEIPHFNNPLKFSTAVKFALIFGLVNLLVKAVGESGLATGGLLVVSFISGLTELDAIALSVSHNLVDGLISERLVVQSIIVAATANTIVKAGIAVTLGSPQLRIRILLVLGATVVAGCVAFLIF